MAQTAHALAWVTGQSEIAANNLKLLTLYSSGKTVDATYALSIGCPQFVAEILLENPGRWYSRRPNPQ